MNVSSLLCHKAAKIAVGQLQELGFFVLFFLNQAHSLEQRLIAEGLESKSLSLNHGSNND